MPEASVHEYNGAVLRQYDVRRPGQSLRVKAKSKPAAVQLGTHGSLRSRVAAPYGGHHAAASLPRDRISHAPASGRDQDRTGNRDRTITK